MKIGITHGDINGVGYEIILGALDDPRMPEMLTPVIYGSGRLANFYRKGMQLQTDIKLNTVANADAAAEGRINLVNVVDEELQPTPGEATKAAGEAALTALECAVRDLREGRIDALVTAPINKNTIQSPEFAFPGHTEYLEASLGEDDHNEALMVLTSEWMRVALVTIHKPLADVAATLTTELVARKARLLARSLTEDFGVSSPRIAVLALNPHAGENGLLGHEETNIIQPAIEQLQKEGVLAFGPYAADGFFGSSAWRKFDGILAMYHDQGLLPFKMLSMDSGVNFTAGLPFVRTSPDHGTAYDIAGKGIASPQSMRQAIFAAIDIVNARGHHSEATANPLRKQTPERRKGKGPQTDAPHHTEE